jgi:N4-gp56 family major capsid protein
MALDNFIPEIWSARLIKALRGTLVYAQPNVMNRDYEGEIAGVGDTVRITSIGDVTVNNYARNADIQAPQELQDAQAMLLIDQQKYFHFQVDDVDKAQMKPQIVDEAMDNAAFALASVADAYVAAKMATGAASTNAIGTDGAPIVPTAVTAYEHLVDLGVKLTEANIPHQNRFVIIPPWFLGLLLKDDRFIKADANTTLYNGEVGKVSGLSVIESNNVPNTAGARYKIIAGSKIATTYAEQVNKVEAYRPERRFADAVKGLHVYGAKVIRPEALAVLTASRTP